MRRLSMIVRVNVHVVVNRTVVDGDWRFDNLSAVVMSRVNVTTSCIISVILMLTSVNVNNSPIQNYTFTWTMLNVLIQWFLGSNLPSVYAVYNIPVHSCKFLMVLWNNFFRVYIEIKEETLKFIFYFALENLHENLILLFVK